MIAHFLKTPYSLAWTRKSQLAARDVHCHGCCFVHPRCTERTQLSGRRWNRFPHVSTFCPHATQFSYCVKILNHQLRYLQAHASIRIWEHTCAHANSILYLLIAVVYGGFNKWGYPNWMVYNGKSHKTDDDWRSPILGNFHIFRYTWTVQLSMQVKRQRDAFVNRHHPQINFPTWALPNCSFFFQYKNHSFLGGSSTVGCRKKLLED